MQPAWLAPGAPCHDAAAGSERRADWAEAAAVPIVITSGEFQPMVIVLRRDRPYRLAIENHDDVPRVFYAPAFFAGSTIAVFTVDGEERGPGCHGHVIVPPLASAEVHLIPRRTGRFPVAESFVPIGWWGTGMGAVYVE